VYVLIHLILGKAKLAILLSRKYRLNGAGSDDIVPILKELVKSCIKHELFFYLFIYLFLSFI